MRVPSESVAKASMPRSMPVSCPVAGSRCIGTSAQEKQTYQPSASRLIVTVLGAPSKGRCHRTPIRPSFDKLPRIPSPRAAAAVLAHLRIGEAAVAVAPLEARVSRRLARLHATEERLKGAVYAR